MELGGGRLGSGGSPEEPFDLARAARGFLEKGTCELKPKG